MASATQPPRGAVLVTRPEPGAAETAARVAALGWEPVLAPALVLRPRDIVIGRAQALLLTSRAAARALPPPIPGLPVLAVGEATAAEARALGWAAEAAAGTARDLAEMAAQRLDPRAGRLLPNGELHLTGLVARADGTFLLKRALHGAPADAAAIGRALGESLRRDSPADILG